MGEHVIVRLRRGKNLRRVVLQDQRLGSAYVLFVSSHGRGAGELHSLFYDAIKVRRARKTERIADPAARLCQHHHLGRLVTPQLAD